MAGITKCLSLLFVSTKKADKVLFCFYTIIVLLCFVDLAWLETVDLPSYLTEKHCRQRVQFAVKSLTLYSHDMPSSFNHSERKTQYRLVDLTFFFGEVCANVAYHHCTLNYNHFAQQTRFAKMTWDVKFYKK